MYVCLFVYTYIWKNEQIDRQLKYALTLSYSKDFNLIFFSLNLYKSWKYIFWLLAEKSNPLTG